MKLGPGTIISVSDDGVNWRKIGVGDVVSFEVQPAKESPMTTPQRKAAAWPPFMLEILIGFRYYAEFPTHWKCASGDKFIKRLVSRGLLEGIVAQPYFKLTPKGEAAVERILTAATAIADRIAPPKTKFITPPVRLCFSELFSGLPRWASGGAVLTPGRSWGTTVHIKTGGGGSTSHSAGGGVSAGGGNAAGGAGGDGGRPVMDFPSPFANMSDAPVGATYTDNEGKKYRKQANGHWQRITVTRTRWCYGIPYDVEVPRYGMEWLSQGEFFVKGQTYRAFMDDVLRQAARGMGLYGDLAAQALRRPGLGRAMYVRGKMHVIDDDWLNRYGHWEYLRKQFKLQGRVKVSEFKKIFNIVFHRTDKLTNKRLERQIYGHAKLILKHPRAGFESDAAALRFYAENTLFAAGPQP
jgi:hypothetical protein